MKFGLLLPHFGDYCSHERVFGHVRWMEEVGFNSVWVRDHLSFRPHAFEGQSSVFLEPFTTLTAIAALTQKLMLGTATVITFRHPLVTSQLFGSLNYVSKGRVIPGIGAGTPKISFDSVGLPYEKRGRIVEELIQILRITWSQEKASFHGEFYNFDDVTIDPRPSADTPIYYGGLTSAAVRRTVKFCDGWLPQRMPFRVLDGMLANLRDLEAKQQKQKRIAITYFPLTSIDRDGTRARQRIGMDRLVANLAHMIEEKGWKGVTPSEKELEGSVIVGSPQECVDQIGEIQKRDIDEIAFDMRNTFDEWETALELLATHVLPHFK
jgi:alkanesulfonate monooxygenase SsuD/methylene tetrahydromethanopterin reductase-like flavin-dependent oxidoreductase (luciferase family)